MAEDVSTSSAPAAVAPAPAAETLARGREQRSERARRSSYRLRFAIVYLFLAAALGAGVSAFAVLATREPPADAAAWSEWEPTGSPSAMVRQIADRIPQAYRQSGQQLVVSTASNLAVPTEQGEIPVEAVFVQPDTSLGLAEEGDFESYDGTKVASYALCAVGGSDNCAITKGEPSADRATFLRRQALELSLYSLKYVDELEAVVVFMPPSVEGEISAIFLPREDVEEELSRPLAELLPTRTPTVGGLGEVDEGNVLRLTDPRTYAFQVQAAANGSPVLVLTPPAPTGP